MDYQQANDKLQGRCRESRKVGNNTYLHRVDNYAIALRLHNTDILTFYADGSIRLDSGGWRTVTTKARMNEYLSGWRITQENGQWFIIRGRPTKRKDPFGESYMGWDWDGVALFADGAILSHGGKVTGGEPIESYTEKLAIRRKVQRYAAAYMRAMEKGKVPAPSGGDCWDCALREVGTGKPMGELHPESHLLSHIEERYYVPSLLMRAMEVMPVSQRMQWAVREKWAPREMLDAGHGFTQRGSSFWSDYIRRDLQKCLSRYMLRQLGQAA